MPGMKLKQIEFPNQPNTFVKGDGSLDPNVYVAANPIDVTHAELLNLIDNELLIPNQQYAIIDYEIPEIDITRNLAAIEKLAPLLNVHPMQIELINSFAPQFLKTNTKSYDIIVTAISKNKLDENAKARISKNCSTFITRDLTKWELKYNVYNNTKMYSWASPNGKGVVYYMKDDYGNAATYDFQLIETFKSNTHNIYDNQINGKVDILLKDIELTIDEKKIVNDTPLYIIPIIYFNLVTSTSECRSNKINTIYCLIEDSSNNIITNTVVKCLNTINSILEYINVTSPSTVSKSIIQLTNTHNTIIKNLEANIGIKLYNCYNLEIKNKNININDISQITQDNENIKVQIVSDIYDSNLFADINGLIANNKSNTTYQILQLPSSSYIVREVKALNVPISCVYDDLKYLKDNNLLIQGQEYILTNFRTTYNHNDGETYLGDESCLITDHLGNYIISDEYNILLKATSTNSFDPKVTILNQPLSNRVYLKSIERWIVYYDFDLDLKGRITYMHDPLYHNTFDFDIFNIRNAWSGYNLTMFLDTNLLSQLNNEFNPNNEYYLWTIGDFKGSYYTEHDIYNLANLPRPEKPCSIYNVTILNSTFIWINVEATGKITSSYNYHKSLVYDININTCNKILIGYEFFCTTIKESTNITLRNNSTCSKIYSARNVLSAGDRSRGLVLGIDSDTALQREANPHFTIDYCTFIHKGNYFNSSDVCYGKYFLSIDSGTTTWFSQVKNIAFVGWTNITFINEMTATTGSIVLIKATDLYDTILTFKKGSKQFLTINIDQLCGIEYDVDIPASSIPSVSDTNDIISINNKEWSDTNLYIGYKDENYSNKVEVVQAKNGIESDDIIFHEEYLQKRGYTYIMPFSVKSYYESYANDWGVIINEEEQSTAVILNFNVCILHMYKDIIGSTIQFYGKTGDKTVYSSKYTLNSNYTLTKITE